MPRLHSSRRVAPLKESDYDHAIDLVDHDSPPQSPRPVSSNGVTNATGESPRPSRDQPRPSVSTSSSKGKGVQKPNGSTASIGPADRPFGLAQDSPRRAPSIAIQEATPAAVPEPTTRDNLSKLSTAEGAYAIDLLYENERGGFLCGIPLFSSKALGNLDPAPWTNAFHRASPTDIHTAQVPDPSWEWVSEWDIYRHDGTDEGGWEYSFMFARKFSWHPPKWWNSFVRRRAWTRKRVKRRADGSPQGLTADYFSVVPASETRSRSGTHGTSRAGSRTPSVGSRLSYLSVESDPGFDVSKERIEDMGALRDVLRRARIDREKVEAVGIYLEQGTDLANLRQNMHGIMLRFLYQASRKMLLANLTRALDETLEALGKEQSAELEDRKAHLEAAVKCADDEVRRLAYWSDIKGMVEGGESANAVRTREGWGREWEGVDQSGPAAPRRQDGERSQL